MQEKHCKTLHKTGHSHTLCLKTDLEEQKSGSVLSWSQEAEISWMKLIMAQSVTAHVAHIRTRFARSQEVTLISQKHTQSHPDTSKHAQGVTQKKTLRHIYPSIHPQNSQMFALQGQEVTCVCRSSETCNTLQVHTHTAGLFPSACVSVCLSVGAFPCVKRAYLSANQSRVYPESHITNADYYY